MTTVRQKLATLQFIILAGSLLVVLTGCGEAVRGTPEPGATPADISTLRTGPFKTDPISFSLKPGLDEPVQVRLVEGRRLLNYLIMPLDIDAELRIQGKTSVFATESGMPAIQGFQDSHRRVIKDNVRFIAGVVSHQSNGSVRTPKGMTVSVLQFESSQESLRAAIELDQISMDTGQRNHLSVPGAPNAKTTISADLQIDSWQQHGDYVIGVSAKFQSATVEETAKKVSLALDTQITALNRQRPVPLDDVLDQPLDSENIVRRSTLPDQRDSLSNTDDFGLFQPSGIVHFERNPAEARRIFEESGVDLIGRRASTVYRARDLAAAFQLQTFLATKGRHDMMLDPPLGIMDAQCVRFDAEDNRGHNAMCALVSGRYVAVVTAKSLGYGQYDQDLQERAAAQYAILRKCE
ncbi:hypothetical protein ACIA5E_23455 [Nocardia asteroides]|uniref:DUF7373 family lipoprotein n=1 Tax=Nocardia asteroides TaxID=1824 RepID=UPI0037B731B6